MLLIPCSEACYWYACSETCYWYHALKHVIGTSVVKHIIGTHALEHVIGTRVVKHVIGLYPEWPHRQCVGLASRRSQVRGSLSAASPVICSSARIAVCNTWSSGSTALCRVGGATSQLDLPSLTPLSVASCG